MKETNKPAMNIRYREPIKGRLPQRGNFKVVRIAFATLALVIVLEIGWHLLVGGR